MVGYETTRVVRSGAGHAGITHLGGDGWLLPVDDVLVSLTFGNTFYVLVDGDRLPIDVYVEGGRPQVRARRGDTWTDALLHLPNCARTG